MKAYLAILFFCLSLSVNAENRTALLMGAWDYQESPLFEPLHGIDKDLDAMEKALTKQGFKVYVVKNPTVAVARGAIDQFGKILKKRRGVALFYFSGHGCEVDGHNYLIPTRNEVKTKEEIVAKAVDTQLILNRMQEAGIGTKLVFLDCCRESFQSGNNTFSPIKADGAFIGYATGSGDASLGTKNGSLYTQSLAKAIGMPKISINDMHTIVTGEVKKKKFKQLPYQYSGLDKLFYFNDPDRKIIAQQSQKMEVKIKRQTGIQTKLSNGTLIDHTALKKKISAVALKKNSTIYKAAYGRDEGIVALQFIDGGRVAGSLLIPKYGVEVNLYGDNSNPGKIRLSLWESGSPVDAGELVKTIADDKITWSAQMKSGDTFTFFRNKIREREPIKSKYVGKAGSATIKVSLDWKADGSVTGKLINFTKGTEHRLAGDHFQQGTLYLDLFTKSKLTARLLLKRDPKDGDLKWTGTYFRVDGTRHQLKFTRKSDEEELRKKLQKELED